jgi:O-antigen ligase/tetratricopeptide (TPR) repeat protein
MATKRRPQTSPSPTPARPANEDAWARLGRALLALLLGLAPVLFSTHTVEAFEFPKLLLLLGCASILAGVGAARGLAHLREHGTRAGLAALWADVRGDLLAWGVLLFIVSASVSTVLSPSPRTSFYGAHESFTGLVTVLAYAVLFFMARALLRDAARLRALLAWPLAGAALAALYALAQVAEADPIRWMRTHEFLGAERAFGSMGNPNFLGALMAIALPLAGARALAEARRGRRSNQILFTLLGILLFAGLGASLSRAAWLGAAVAAGLFLVGSTRLLATAEGRAGLWRAAAVLVLAAALSVALVPRLRELTGRALQRVLLTIEKRPGVSDAPFSLREEPRLFLWPSAWRMFLAHPVVGVGQDLFQLAYQRYRSLGTWTVEGHRTPGKAHNEPLHVLATQGALGGLALLVIVAGTLSALRRAWARTRDEPELLLGVGAALAAFAVQALFSFTVIGFGVLIVTLLGWLAGGAARASGATQPAPRERPAPNPRWTPLWRLAQVAVLLLAALGVQALVVLPLRADLAAQRGVVGRQGAPGQALLGFGEAVSLRPDHDLYWIQLGVAHFEMGNSLRGLPQRRGQLEAAREAFRRAVQLVPINSYAHGGLARALGEMAREQPPLATRDEAYTAFEEAMQRDPRNPYWPVEAGRFALDVGDLARVESWGRRGLEIDPMNGAATWLLGNVMLQRALAQAEATPARQAAFAQAGALLRQAAFERHWYSDNAQRSVAGSQAAAALVMAGRLPEAQAAAELATQVDPDYADARYNLGQVHERSGNAEQARFQYQQALRLQPDHEEAQRALARLASSTKATASPAPGAARVAAPTPGSTEPIRLDLKPPSTPPRQP